MSRRRRTSDRGWPPKKGDDDERNALGSLHFHYNRDERLRTASESVRRRGAEQSFFRRNRTALIILLDLVVVLLMFGVYYFFGRGDDSTNVLNGYAYQVKGVQFGAQALVTLHIDRQKENLPDEGDIVEVAFSIPGVALSATEKDVLPSRNGAERVIRAVLEPLPKAGRGNPSRESYQVAAEVRVGDTSFRLVAPLAVQ